MTMLSFSLPDAFHAEVKRRGETMVVVASGEIDLASVDELEVHLRDALNRSSHVVLDLRRVGFIDCAGLRRMLDIQNAAGEGGGDFAVIPGPSHVQRVFLITRTFGAFHFIDCSEIAAA